MDTSNALIKCNPLGSKIAVFPVLYPSIYLFCRLVWLFCAHPTGFFRSVHLKERKCDKKTKPGGSIRATGPKGREPPFFFGWLARIRDVTLRSRWQLLRSKPSFHCPSLQVRDILHGFLWIPIDSYGFLWIAMALGFTKLGTSTGHPQVVEVSTAALPPTHATMAPPAIGTYPPRCCRRPRALQHPGGSSPVPSPG